MIEISEQTLETGSIVEGTISGITSFGAFVKLPSNEEGLIHISEIANEYVTSIDNFVTLGATVKVKVLGLNKKNKYDLSLKQVSGLPSSGAKEFGSPSSASTSVSGADAPPSAFTKRRFTPAKFKKPDKEVSPFEDRMNSFLKRSEEKLIDLKRNIQNKQGVKKRKKK